MDSELIKSDQVSSNSIHGDMENVSNGDTTLDLLEQKQAQEQARLLQRFRELRQWQLKQQEQLMQQQQQQLEGLRKEQIKVQSMLTKQREAQWGAGRVVRHSLSPSRTPPRRQMNQSELVTTVMSMVSHRAEANESASPVMSSSLPLPVIYAQPQLNEDDAATNPELFSNPDSHHGSQDIDVTSEDGLFPLQEMDSDQGEMYETVFNVRDSASEFSVGTENEYPQPGTSVGSSHHQSMDFLRTLTAEDMNSIQTITTLQHMLQTATPNTLQKMLGILPQKLPIHLADNSQVPSEQLCSSSELGRDKNMNCFQETRSPMDSCVIQGEKSSSQDMLEEDDSESQNVTVKENEVTEAGFDDRPIKPGIGGKKTFEQLLEEEILAEEEKLKMTVESPSQKKKPFLRKGHGLSRFNLGKSVPVKTKVKTESKRKSVETGRNCQTNENTKRSVDQRGARVVGGNIKQKKDNKVSVSKPLPASQKSGKPCVTNSLKLLTNKQPEDRPVGMNSSQPHPPVPTQSTPLKADNIPTMSEQSHVDVQTEADIDTDEPSFCGKARLNEKVENQELEVFEMFEDFAENVSFASNSSVVVKLLEKQRQKQEGINVPVEEIKAIIEEKMAQKQKALHASEQIAKEDEPVDDKDDTIVDGSDMDSSSDDTLTDSDSSFTTDSGEDDKTDLQDKNEEQNYSVSDMSQNNDMKNGLFFTKNGTNVSETNASNEVRVSVPVSPSKSIVRKIASKDIKIESSANTHSLLKRLSQNSGAWLGAARDNPDIENIKPSHAHSAFSSEKVNSDADNVRKQFAQVQNGRWGSDDDYVDHDEQVVTQPVQDRNENAHNSDDEEEEEDQFDDDEEWTDSAPRVQSGRDSGIDSTEQVSNTSCTPPTSRLVARLFPKLKEAQQAKQLLKQQQEQDKMQSAANVALGEGIQSKILRDKLVELEKEIEKFRNENAALDKLHREREEGLNKLKKEISDFEKEKTDELKRLEEFKTQEIKKIRHERKMFDKYQKTIRSMPDKRDRDEIDMLRTQLSDLQDELKRKEARWNSTNSRLRDKLAQSELENKELQEEIKLLEKRRLESMQKENGYKKINIHNFPRSSTPTEDINLTRSYQGMREPPKAVSPSNVSSTLAQSRPIANGYAPTSSSLPISSSKPDVPHQPLNISGDAVPRGLPTVAATLQGVSQTNTNGLPQPVNTSVPRKQTTKFTSQNPGIDKGDRQYEEMQNPDGKVERTYTNGAREILFSNGTRKEISSDGQSIVVSFFNGDIKQIFPDQRVVYFYADAQTTHTTYPDGLEILQFQNNQIEKHYPDGTKEITFPDQTIKYLFPNGSEESIFPDGTVIRVDSNGDKTMEFPNGQREIHTEQYKKREYPDGTVKTVYPDGRQETRYSTGRIRLKDKDGNIIMDRVC